MPACGAPVSGDDGWEIAEPSATGMQASKLCELARYLDSSPQDNIHGVVVVQDGRLVFEKYLDGDDQRWGVQLGVTRHGPTVRHDVRSVTKSVISLLVGIAIDRQLIAGVDQPVFDFFPEYASLRTPEKDRVLLRHLLAMSSGRAWNEHLPYTDLDNSERLMAEAEDPYRYVLEQPVRSPPDVVWNYSGGDTQLLEGILRAVVKQPVDEFAGEALFAPLGITDVEWIRMPNGHLAAASGLRLRPRDMAKLGQLYLDDGKWHGRQIVSATWLHESAKPRVSSSYGYQWWTGLSVVGEKVVERVEARGLGGQRIFIVPSSDLVVVVTGGSYIKRGIENEGEITAGILDNYVLPAVLANQAARLP
ncbi:MAG TPA: serine hydrolase [Geminicoccus sp.]|uniref:serine hydrolase domain-containing protein n=1 Tax=Geminicoccus sp. TaxID=2024832 RepID=UPI002CDEB0F6|nr:serine hydrolase [Geminicoccus sp.]HWL71827.1 serine hydrolase [Geminicoccus sp.]